MRNQKAGRPNNGEVNMVTVKRLKELRRRSGDKQEVIAKLVLGMKSATQYGRYERGETAIPDKLIEKLAVHYQVPADFIRGYTDTQDLTAYELEYQEACDSWAEEHAAQQRAERTRRLNFFDFCGFQYEDLAAKPGPREFEGLNADTPIDAFRQHKIIDPSGALEPITLSDAELSALLDNVHSFIAYECFKHQLKRKEATNDGDHRADL